MKSVMPDNRLSKRKGAKTQGRKEGGRNCHVLSSLRLRVKVLLRKHSRAGINSFMASFVGRYSRSRESKIPRSSATTRNE